MHSTGSARGNQLKVVLANSRGAQRSGSSSFEEGRQQRNVLASPILLTPASPTSNSRHLPTNNVPDVVEPYVFKKARRIHPSPEQLAAWKKESLEKLKKEEMAKLELKRLEKFATDRAHQMRSMAPERSAMELNEPQASRHLPTNNMPDVVEQYVFKKARRIHPSPEQLAAWKEKSLEKLKKEEMAKLELKRLEKFATERAHQMRSMTPERSAMELNEPQAPDACFVLAENILDAILARKEAISALAVRDVLKFAFDRYTSEPLQVSRHNLPVLQRVINWLWQRRMISHPALLQSSTSPNKASFFYSFDSRQEDVFENQDPSPTKLFNAYPIHYLDVRDMTQTANKLKVLESSTADLYCSYENLYHQDQACFRQPMDGEIALLTLFDMYNNQFYLIHLHTCGQEELDKVRKILQKIQQKRRFVVYGINDILGLRMENLQYQARNKYLNLWQTVEFYYDKKFNNAENVSNWANTPLRDGQMKHAAREAYYTAKLSVLFEKIQNANLQYRY